MFKHTWEKNVITYNQMSVLYHYNFWHLASHINSRGYMVTDTAEWRLSYPIKH
jgi:hypothetical protein